MNRQLKPGDVWQERGSGYLYLVVRAGLNPAIIHFVGTDGESFSTRASGGLENFVLDQATYLFNLDGKHMEKIIRREYGKHPDDIRQREETA